MFYVEHLHSLLIYTHTMKCYFLHFITDYSISNQLHYLPK